MSIMRSIFRLTLIPLILVTSAATSPHQSTLVYPPWKHTLGLRRVGQTHLDLYSGYKKKFSNPQGVAAVKLVFNDEPGRGDDEELTVYGVNSGTDEIFYNKSMVSLGFFGREGAGAGEFSDPVGIAADKYGNVVVADRGNRRVVYLQNNANELEFVHAFGLPDKGQPTGIALAESTVYVTDSGNDRIVVTNLSGEPLDVIGGNGGLVDPFGIAAIAGPEWNYYGSEFLVVTDSLHQRITMFSLDGRILVRRRFNDVSGDNGGFFFVAIDYYSNVYVTDTRTGCLYKMDRRLNYLTRIGCHEGPRHDLVEPRGVAINRRFGQVFVAEKAGASYYWVGTDVKNLRCRAQPNGDVLVLEVSFLLTEHSTVTLSLTSEDREVVHTVLKERVLSPGLRRETFLLNPTDLPCPVTECDYLLMLFARPTYSSRKYHRIEQFTPVRLE